MLQSLRMGEKRKDKQLGIQEYLEQAREKKRMRLTENHIEQLVAEKPKPEVQQLSSTVGLVVDKNILPNAEQESESE